MNTLPIDLSDVLKSLAQALREISHLVERADAALEDPGGDLVGPIAGLAHGGGQGLQLMEREALEVGTIRRGRQRVLPRGRRDGCGRGERRRTT